MARAQPILIDEIRAQKREKTFSPPYREELELDVHSGILKAVEANPEPSTGPTGKEAEPGNDVNDQNLHAFIPEPSNTEQQAQINDQGSGDDSDSDNDRHRGDLDDEEVDGEEEEEEEDQVRRILGLGMDVADMNNYLDHLLDDDIEDEEDEEEDEEESVDSDESPPSRGSMPARDDSSTDVSVNLDDYQDLLDEIYGDPLVPGRRRLEEDEVEEEDDDLEQEEVDEERERDLFLAEHERDVGLLNIPRWAMATNNVASPSLCEEDTKSASEKIWNLKTFNYCVAGFELSNSSARFFPPDNTPQRNAEGGRRSREPDKEEGEYEEMKSESDEGDERSANGSDDDDEERESESGRQRPNGSAPAKSESEYESDQCERKESFRYFSSPMVRLTPDRFRKESPFEIRNLRVNVEVKLPNAPIIHFEECLLERPQRPKVNKEIVENGHSPRQDEEHNEDVPQSPSADAATSRKRRRLKSQGLEGRISREERNGEKESEGTEGDDEDEYDEERDAKEENSDEKCGEEEDGQRRRLRKRAANNGSNDDRLVSADGEVKDEELEDEDQIVRVKRPRLADEDGQEDENNDSQGNSAEAEDEEFDDNEEEEKVAAPTLAELLAGRAVKEEVESDEAEFHVEGAALERYQDLYESSDDEDRASDSDSSNEERILESSTVCVSHLIPFIRDHFKRGYEIRDPALERLLQAIKCSKDTSHTCARERIYDQLEKKLVADDDGACARSRTWAAHRLPRASHSQPSLRQPEPVEQLLPREQPKIQEPQEGEEAQEGGQPPLPKFVCDVVVKQEMEEYEAQPSTSTALPIRPSPLRLNIPGVVLEEHISCVYDGKIAGLKFNADGLHGWFEPHLEAHESVLAAESADADQLATQCRDLVFRQESGYAKAYDEMAPRDVVMPPPDPVTLQPIVPFIDEPRQMRSRRSLAPVREIVQVRGEDDDEEYEDGGDDDVDDDDKDGDVDEEKDNDDDDDDDEDDDEEDEGEEALATSKPLYELGLPVARRRQRKRRRKRRKGLSLVRRRVDTSFRCLALRRKQRDKMNPRNQFPEAEQVDPIGPSIPPALAPPTGLPAAAPPAPLPATPLALLVSSPSPHFIPLVSPKSSSIRLLPPLPMAPQLVDLLPMFSLPPLQMEPLESLYGPASSAVPMASPPLRQPRFSILNTVNNVEFTPTSNASPQFNALAPIVAISTPRAKLNKNEESIESRKMSVEPRQMELRTRGREKEDGNEKNKETKDPTSLSAPISDVGPSSKGRQRRTPAHPTASSENSTPVVEKSKSKKENDQQEDASSSKKRSTRVVKNLNATAKTKETSQQKVQEETYCYCKRISFGDMVGCDNEHCVIEWFHFECVKLSNKPKGKWFCPDCRQGENSKLPKMTNGTPASSGSSLRPNARQQNDKGKDS